VSSAAILNSIGLGFDIAGVVTLFYFGPPVLNITRDGYKILPFDPNDDAATQRNRAIADRHALASKLGLALLIVGFACQLISNFVRA
jgi:hypothetical protein